MPSLSFDPFAHIYDETRGYPEAVARQIAQAIDQAANATAQTAYLEVGVGTGRIAIPLSSLGRTYTGVDISQKMVDRLKEKLQDGSWHEQLQPWATQPDEDAARTIPVSRYTRKQPLASLRIAMSDITNLPFHERSFDVAISVHVFHLVDGWQNAVNEVLRVLRPGGLLLHCGDDHGPSEVQPIQDQWRKIIDELGFDPRRPGAPSHQIVTRYLQQRFETQQIKALTWQRQLTPRQVLRDIELRHFSSTWVIPEPIFAQAIPRLRVWVAAHYGARMDTVYEQESYFVINKTRVA
jgi:ubiquinone/menaquinone biosynthesis C-methylase UbiE